MPRISHRDILTTTEVANHCRVSTKTAAGWIDSGRLRGWKIPGSMDRRVAVEDMIEFCREHKVPIGDLETRITIGVLCVGPDETLPLRLVDALPAERFRVFGAPDAFEAGAIAARLRPRVAIVDFAVAGASTICQRLRTAEPAPFVLAILPGDHANGFDRSAIHETFRRPFDPALLAARIQTISAPRKGVLA